MSFVRRCSLAALALASGFANAEASRPGRLPFVASIDRFQVAPEERLLAECFHDAFFAYRDRARRWLWDVAESPLGAIAGFVARLLIGREPRAAYRARDARIPG